MTRRTAREMAQDRLATAERKTAAVEARVIRAAELALREAEAAEAYARAHPLLAEPVLTEAVSDCEFIATSRTAVAALVAALREALETSARLNRRSQIAEAAIADLTREPVGGRKHRSVAAEVWERCEESHGLACRTTREARDEVERLRVRAAAVAAAIGEQCRFDSRGCWVHAADLTPDGRCALLADAQAITAAETTAAPGPHSGTPATVEGVSVAHSEGE